MTPTSVLSDSTTTRHTMNTASHNNQSIFSRSDDLHNFAVYQLTTLAASAVTIHTLVPFLLVPPPPLYRKNLIAKLLFHHHPLFCLVSFLYLSKYYCLRATSIRDSFFCVDKISASSTLRGNMLSFPTLLIFNPISLTSFTFLH